MWVCKKFDLETSNRFNPAGLSPSYVYAFTMKISFSQRFLALTALSVALAGGVSLAQQKPPAQAPTGERPQGVLVDFIAVGADGAPVTDLTAADVAVRLNGKVRTIQSLKLMRTGATSGPIMDNAPAAVPAPYGANVQTAATTGRRVILAVDTDSFRAGSEGPLRQGVAGLLTSFGPSDRVLLATLPYGGIVVPFTGDHNRIRTALSTLAGQRAQSETGSEMACRTRRVLESLSGLLDSAPRDGAPVTVLFFTAGMAGPRRDALTGRAPGMCELETRVFQNVGTSAAGARASFYIVHPDDVRGGTSNNLGSSGIGSDNPLEGIENLAGVTGAERLPLLGVGTGALAQVARETSAYYVAELEADRADFDGESKRLNIRVARPNVTVRARPAIAFFSPTPKAPKTATPTVHQLLLVSEEFADLPLRVAGFAMRGQDGKVKVIGVAETADPTAVLATAAMALVDSAGRVVGQATPSDAAEIPLATAMLVAPGKYRLRVAATDTTGRYGTADVEVDAGLTEVGPLKLGALTLGLSRHGGLTPRLEFGAEPLAIGSFEIYDAPESGMRLSAVLDVARTPDGPAIVSSRLAIERGEDDRLVATGAIPIGALPAGDYVVRGIVSIEGGASGKVMRTLRKK